MERLMYTIMTNDEMAPGMSEPCLECRKLVNVAPQFAVEVVGSDDGREGYLHPPCRAKWEKNHPGFRYVSLC